MMFSGSTARSANPPEKERPRTHNIPWWGRPTSPARFDPGHSLVGRYGFHSDGELTPSVEVTPSNAARRSTFSTKGAFAELIRTGGAQQVEYQFRGRFHLLVCGGGIRNDGESWVEGLPRSTMRDLRRRLTFVPAGCGYYERRHQPRSAPTLYVYFGAVDSAIGPNPSEGEAELHPRLLFEDFALWTTAMKLQSLMESPSEQERDYIDALINVLKAELFRYYRGERKTPAPIAGGLAAWQQKVVSDFIEANISRQVSVTDLAALVRLSPYHFCRSFKASFGVPPHKYHVIRRIERAKQLLSDPSLSMTEIGGILGFSDSASFSASFRRVARVSPTQHQRSFG
jgi:AraC family transcriptional regulator